MTPPPPTPPPAPGRGPVPAGGGGPDGGYLRQPSLAAGLLAFVCEDDLWLAPLDRPVATRVTAGAGESCHPRLSPDGRLLAYTGTQDGPAEVYVQPVPGGPARRLTFQAADRCTVLGWHPRTREVLYASTAGQPRGFGQRLFAVDPAGGLPRLLPYGPATAVDVAGDGRMVLGRNTTDPARWKRYRGGTAGELWVGDEQQGTVFRRLLDLPGTLAFPCWAAGRVWFVSDHEGTGNVYSCRPDGTGLTRHTDHRDHYVRALSGDGSRLVYQCGARLHLLDPAQGRARPLEVAAPLTRSQWERRFVDAEQYLDGQGLSGDGSRLAITSRGRLFTLDPWQGPVRAHGDPCGTRYRLPVWLADGTRLVAAAADGRPAEHLALVDTERPVPPAELPLPDLGRVGELAASPAGDWIALATNRHELHVLCLPPASDASFPDVPASDVPASDVPASGGTSDASGTPGTSPLRHLRLDHSPHGPITGLAWSPDGRRLAYAWPCGPHRSEIRLADVADGVTRAVTEPVLGDRAPSFDPDGRYLYFIGQRDLTTVQDRIGLDFGLPHGGHPYAVPLLPATALPWTPAYRTPAPTADPTADPVEPATEAAGDDPPPTGIDLDGIAHRAAALPVPPGDYRQVLGTHGGVLLLSAPPELVGDPSGTVEEDAEEPAGVVDHYQLDDGTLTRYVEGVDAVHLDAAARTLLAEAGARLRVLPAHPREGEEPRDAGGEVGRASGWADLGRVRVPVHPRGEWRQMFREAWRLQREHFWDPDMAGLDWEAVHRRYLPLLDLVGSRAELSDLVWEMQGELGASHAYELGGDHRRPERHAQGFLGADLAPGPGGVRVARIPAGDPWHPRASSPLLDPGTGIRPGDLITAVDGVPTGPAGPDELLVGRAGQAVELTVRAAADPDAPPRRAAVRTLADESVLRYRAWVRDNRAYVHAGTAGRVGYLHVPDMLAGGWAEFLRGFLAEHDREALVVDVRFNGGGFVSPLVLERLARRRQGYEFGRWNGALPYPAEAPRGPMVALVNEHTGSDGDIFAHVFRQMGLGPLVGTRTWGGVIATEPRFPLADGTITTQPEYVYRFDRVGGSLENSGVRPDVPVAIAPHDHALGLDTQLARAVEVALDELAARPPHTPLPTQPPGERRRV
ncbi:putative protease [Actinacidiphila reveromycinica]|uniref:Tricorn protease homolog n=1 Tax=Actinacidiphila reveromycinica TaxID=659352 RepID=A0A7U3UQ62_9ACTN|nr:S41 family peptidase [Streptomyces sp. SN-593]BBA96678.1 putative protease [Streptomyces sp. SN-593]